MVTFDISFADIFNLDKAEVLSSIKGLTQDCGVRI